MKRRTLLGLLTTGLIGFVFQALSKANELHSTADVEYASLWEMIDDIADHVAKTGESVLVYDRPYIDCVGFACDTKAWRFNIIKNWRKSALKDPEKAKVVSELIKTEDGRIRMAAMIQCIGMAPFRLDKVHLKG